MKALKKRLTDLGFKAITRSLFACRAGEILHANHLEFADLLKGQWRSFADKLRYIPL